MILTGHPYRAHPAISHCSHLLLKCRVAINMSLAKSTAQMVKKLHICEILYFGKLLYFQILLLLFLHTSLLQGSNLALANLLNASSFLQNASRNCNHLLFLASGNKSLSFQPNYATQHTLYDRQCRS